MTDSKLNNFDPADFLAKAGLDLTITHVQAKETFFRKGTRPAPSSIFSRRVPKSLSFHRRVMRLPSPFSRLATLSISQSTRRLRRKRLSLSLLALEACSPGFPPNLCQELICSQQLSFITAIRRRRFESFGKELKKGMRVVAGKHMVRSVHVSATPRRNSYHRHIVADALELADGFLKRKVIQFGVNYNYINVRKSTQKP
jgi:hypothetical protein